MKISRLASILASVALLLSLQAPALATSIATHQTLVIGVDHVDNANQQPDLHRFFEYTDFFSRTVTVHTGDTINFLAAPNSFHVIALAADEKVARQVYPIWFTDTGDPHLATGTGLPKLVLGPSFLSITGGSTSGGGAIGNPNSPPACGVPALGQPNCTFTGGNDIEAAGPNPGFGPTGPAPADWLININAPPGKYQFFCYIHPGMRGTLNVVGPGQETTSQSQINAASQTQFQADRAAGLAAEQAANQVRFTGGQPGTRNYVVQVGVGTPDLKVAINEMLPRQALNMVSGDQVTYQWNDPHNVHSVTFPAEADDILPPPIGLDCGTTFIPGPPGGPPCNDPAEGVPEAIFDPGNTPSGSILTNVTALIDAGILIGKGYDVTPAAQSWSARVSGISAHGTFHYQCTIHDYMQGTINVAAR